LYPGEGHRDDVLASPVHVGLIRGRAPHHSRGCMPRAVGRASNRTGSVGRAPWLIAGDNKGELVGVRHGVLLVRLASRAGRPGGVPGRLAIVGATDRHHRKLESDGSSRSWVVPVTRISAMAIPTSSPRPIVRASARGGAPLGTSWGRCGVWRLPLAFTAVGLWWECPVAVWRCSWLVFRYGTFPRR
jgi:hypothetical protein